MSTTADDARQTHTAAAPDSDARTHAHQLTEQNRAHFDKIAGDLDALPQALALAKLFANAILEDHWMHLRDEHDGDAVDPSTDRPLGGTRMLEFACGTGLVSRELAPFVANVVGVDISQGMVDVYNQKAKAAGFGEEDVHAVCLDLLGEEGAVAPEEQTASVLRQVGGEMFDLIVCNAAYHHLPDPARVTKALSALLAPKGTLIVTDIHKSSDDFDLVKRKGAFGHDSNVPESLRNMDFEKTVAHRGGFDEADMKAFMEDEGGLTDFAFRLVGKMDFFAPPGNAAGTNEASVSKESTGESTVGGGHGHAREDHSHGQGHGHPSGPIEWFLAKANKAQ